MHCFVNTGIVREHRNTAIDHRSLFCVRLSLTPASGFPNKAARPLPRHRETSPSACPGSPPGFHRESGGGMGIRTPGLVIANDALYQLSYTPEILGRSGLKTNPPESSTPRHGFSSQTAMEIVAKRRKRHKKGGLSDANKIQEACPLGDNSSGFGAGASPSFCAFSRPFASPNLGLYGQTAGMRSRGMGARSWRGELSSSGSPAEGRDRLQARRAFPFIEKTHRAAVEVKLDAPDRLFLPFAQRPAPPPRGACGASPGRARPARDAPAARAAADKTAAHFHQKSRAMLARPGQPADEGRKVALAGWQPRRGLLEVRAVAAAQRFHLRSLWTAIVMHQQWHLRAKAAARFQMQMHIRHRRKGRHHQRDLRRLGKAPHPALSKLPSGLLRPPRSIA